MSTLALEIARNKLIAAENPQAIVPEVRKMLEEDGLSQADIKQFFDDYNREVEAASDDEWDKMVEDAEQAETVAHVENQDATVTTEVKVEEQPPATPQIVQPDANGEFPSPADGAIWMLMTHGIPQTPLRSPDFHDKKAAGKAPFLPGWQKPENVLKTSEAIRDAAAKYPGCNFGSVCGIDLSGTRVFAFEADTPPEGVPNIRARFKNWCIGGDLSGTSFSSPLLIQSSIDGDNARGHRYYLYANPTEGFVKMSRDQITNISQGDVKHHDFSLRVTGEQCVSPGSVHPRTRQQYRVISTGPLAPPDAFEVEFWNEQRKDGAKKPEPKSADAPVERRFLTAAQIPTAVQNETIRLVNAGHNKELIPEIVHTWLLDNIAPGVPLHTAKAAEGIARILMNEKCDEQRQAFVHGEFHTAYRDEACGLLGRGHDPAKIPAIVIEWMHENVADGNPIDDSKVEKECVNCCTIYQRGSAPEASTLEMGANAQPATNFLGAKVEGDDDSYVIAPSSFGEHHEGWFPRGDVSLVGAYSGGGKTTLILDMLEKQAAHAPFFGRATYGLPFLVMLADRSPRGLRRTMRRMKIDLKELPHAIYSGEDIADAIEKELVTRKPMPAVVFLEGIDLMGDSGKGVDVSVLLRKLARIADYYFVAIIGSTGSPKVKGKDGYKTAREKFIGSGSWARLVETMILLERPTETAELTTMTVLPRQSKPLMYTLRFDDGRLREATEEEANLLKPQVTTASSKLGEAKAWLRKVFTGPDGKHRKEVSEGEYRHALAEIVETIGKDTLTKARISLEVEFAQGRRVHIWKGGTEAWN